MVVINASHALKLGQTVYENTYFTLTCTSAKFPQRINHPAED